MRLDALKRLGSLAKVRPALAASVNLPGNGLSPIAIDFGVAGLKLLQVQGSDPPALVAAAYLATPEPLIDDDNKRLDFQTQHLPKLIREGGFKGKRAVCAIPAFQTFCKNLQFPKTDGVSTQTMVDAAIPTQFNRDPSQLVYRTIDVSMAGSGKCEVIVVAAMRELVDRLMRAIAAAKLQPVGMHSEFAATLRAFDYVNRREGDLVQTTLYLDVGCAATKIMIAHGKEMSFARVVNVGGKHLDDLAADQLACMRDQARRLRLALNADAPLEPVAVAAARSDVPPLGAPAIERRGAAMPTGFTPEVRQQAPVPVAPEEADLSELLETLTDEIQMCARYHASQFPARKVDRVLFVGGEARHRGLCQHIAKALRLPAQAADPMARVARSGNEPALGIDLKQPQPGWAVALGLCLSPTDL
jgi:type IV pilus assembly protein PilM